MLMAGLSEVVMSLIGSPEAHDIHALQRRECMKRWLFWMRLVVRTVTFFTIALIVIIIGAVYFKLM